MPETITRNDVVTTVAQVIHTIHRDHGRRWWYVASATDDLHIWIVNHGGTTAPETAADIIETIADLDYLDRADPLTIVDDTWTGTADAARAMLTDRYTLALTAALNHITWSTP